MLRNKRITAPLTLKADDGAEGSVSAVFSTFNVRDRDGDVVLPSAFSNGQAVPMVWHHDWSLPVGRGTVQVESDRAVFHGQFFTETTAGRDAYLTVKAMAELQEWSWGFRVTDGEPGVKDGEDVFFIKGAELFEVSPVLVGAGIGTYTAAIKGHGLRYEDHVARVQDDFRELIERTKAGLAKRAVDARGLSESRRRQVDAVIASLESVTAELRGLITSSEQPTPARLRAEFLRIQATLNGVATGGN